MQAADVVSLLEEATQSVAGRVTEESHLEALDGWDSMGMVMFVGLVQDRTGVELTVYELRGCDTPRALSKLIASRLGA
ncbi:MAG TPA: acyl carrier protein [Planctomycetota bacterium]|nr:acyl carrier protein [Planctomycetota bacterium]